MNAEQSFFSVFCIEALAKELGISGDKIYKMLSDDSDILDSYIVTHYDALHTQGKNYIVRELTELMREKGVLQ
jgi:DNA-binding phage protein